MWSRRRSSVFTLTRTWMYHMYEVILRLRLGLLGAAVPAGFAIVGWLGTGILLVCQIPSSLDFVLLEREKRRVELRRRETNSYWGRYLLNEYAVKFVSKCKANHWK